jgi:hypothetical protein
MPYPPSLGGGRLLADQGKYMVLVDASSPHPNALATGVMVRAVRYLYDAA